LKVQFIHSRLSDLLPLWMVGSQILCYLLSFSLSYTETAREVVYTSNSLCSWFCCTWVSWLSLFTISVLFFRPQVRIISRALRSRSVLVTSLCFSLMCMLRAASVAYSFPQLYRHGNSFWSSLAHLLTCFLRWFSLLVFLISIFCIRLFISICLWSSVLWMSIPVWEILALCLSSKLFVWIELIFFGLMLNLVTLETLKGLNICKGF